MQHTITAKTTTKYTLNNYNYTYKMKNERSLKGSCGSEFHHKVAFQEK